MNSISSPFVITAALFLTSCATTPQSIEVESPSQLTEFTYKHLKMYEAKPDVHLSASACADPKVLKCMNIHQWQCLLITKVAIYKCEEKSVALFGSEADLEDPSIEGYFKGCYQWYFLGQSPVGNKATLDCWD